MALSTALKGLRPKHGVKKAYALSMALKGLPTPLVIGLNVNVA